MKKISMDLHTHTAASGHATHDTITDLARAASKAGLLTLGISDHGPATPLACDASYFRGLKLAPKLRYGVKMLYGAELNIISSEGGVDLEDSVLRELDYAFISFHIPTFTPLTKEGNTDAMIAAMDHPNVRFLGHPDDSRFPLDYERLLNAAKAHNICPEINNVSLAPGAYRVNCHENCCTILKICRKLSLPVLLSSDSHGSAHVGDVSYAEDLIEGMGFPDELILNRA
ncbi:MAG: phosphatase [Lachnospiraceae bacterium]|nr:phosphatase [Lachnospiraceae bacterium]